MRFTKDDMKIDKKIELKSDSSESRELTGDQLKELVTDEKKIAQQIQKPKINLSQKLSESEIKERLYQMTDEIIAQLSIPGKTLDELENTYLMFNGQMSVVNRCRLLSFEEQQELNAKVFATYYQKKTEFKKAEFLKQKKIKEADN